MELIGSLFLVMALALIVALFIARPFFEKVASQPSGLTHTEGEEQEHRRSSLLAERDRVLNALQELEFDNTLGKVPAEDFPQQRTLLLKSGADVLRQLDQIQGETSFRDTAEERIAAAVAARRADSAERKLEKLAPTPAGVASGIGSLSAGEGVVQAQTNGKQDRPGRDSVEDLIATKRRQREEKSAGFCPRCGKPAQKSDRFCSRCGATL